jgi:hypothetical protein
LEKKNAGFHQTKSVNNIFSIREKKQAASIADKSRSAGNKCVILRDVSVISAS